MVLTSNELYDRVADTPLRGVDDYYQLSFRAMGCPCEVLFYSRSRAQGEQFKHAVLRWVAEFEAKYSRFIESSLVSRINQAAGKDWVPVDMETAEIFALCDWFHWMTRGVFDPTSGPFVQLWDYHRVPPVVPSAVDIEAARGLIGWRKLEREAGRVRLPVQGMAIDLGGIGKEYAVDRVVGLGMSMGIQNLLVDFGHDLRVHGQPPQKGAWRIGLEEPDHPGRCWCGLGLDDGAVCTSGNYLRYMEVNGKRYGHIIDPRTGYPVQGACKSVSVVAPSCTEAGIIATTALILGVEEGMAFMAERFSAQGCMWTDHGVFETRRFGEHVLDRKKR